MSLIVSVIRYCDFLGEAPKLKVNNSPLYKTLFGGVISLVLASFSIIGIIYFGRELFLKENPFVVMSIKDYDTVGPFKLNNEEFEIYSAIEFENYTYYNNPQVFKFEAYEETIVENKGIQSYSSKKLEINQCSSYYNNTDLNNKIDIDTFYCIKPNSTHIEGYWGNKINQYIRIKLFKCNNNTSNNNCLSEDDINQAIKGGIVSMYLRNSLLQLKNYTNPIVYDNDNQYFSLNLDFTFTLFINLSRIIFQNDIGYLLENIEEVKAFEFSTPKLIYFGKRGDLLADITIQSKKRGLIITRSYLKFQDVLTKIGGLIKALLLISNFLAIFISNVQFMNDYVFNIRYNYKNFKNESKIEPTHIFQDNKRRIISSSSMKDLQILNKISKFSSTKLSIVHLKIENLNRKSIDETNANYKMTQVISDFKNYICSYCSYLCLSKYKLNASRVFENKLNKCLSIENIFEKMNIISKIEERVFTENERIEGLSIIYIDVIT